MKVVHLTSVHRAADSRIFDRECRSLAAAGHDVVLLCRAERDASSEGVHIKPLSLPRNRAARMTAGAWRALAAARREAADVYHLHDPELLLVAPLLRRRGRVVFDAHEDLPRQILSKSWVPALLRRTLAWIVRRMLPLLFRSIDAVVAATPAIAETIRGVPVALVQNYPRVENPVPDTPFAERHRAVGYVGGLDRIRGAEVLVEALDLLSQDSPIELRFAGVIDPGLEGELRQQAGWRRVRSSGWLDKGGVARLLAGCRAGVVTFLPAPNHLSAQPNKLFEYMASGLCVVASDFPLWREILETEDCGLVVDPHDPKAIADALTFATSDDPEAEAMGRRGRAAVERSYNWRSQEKALLALYEAL